MSNDKPQQQEIAPKLPVIPSANMFAEGIPVITIDGPTCSGKGTIAKLLADRIGWHFLDSGILYRVLGLLAFRNKISPENALALTDLAENLRVEIVEKPDQQQKVIYQGEDITDAIRQENCGKYASQVATIPEIRSALLGCLQSFRKIPGLVADGRDMGTVVFKDAILKIFLTANPKERALRRWQQLQSKNINVSLREVASDLFARDVRDEERLIAPLKPALNAEIIDTTDLSVAKIMELLLKKLGALGINSR